MTNPDWVPTMRRAAALVTDGGGMTCHAAIVARELGVPCVVGDPHGDHRRCATASWSPSTAPRARSTRARRRRDAAAAAAVTGRGAAGAPSAPRPLATRLYVNLAIAEHAEEVAALPVDGVGLLRAEFMITDALGGVHPRELLATGRPRRVRRPRCRRRCCAITRAFAPRPVVYRTIDFRTNEFRGLDGRRASSSRSRTTR